MVFLSSCDDELKLVSRDFSVTLKSIDVGTAVVGKPVNCTLTISDLDPDNGDQILTRFEVRDGDGVILVDNNEYSPGETFEYDFKANNRLDFDFIPATEGEAYIVMGVASELVTRSDSIKLKVSSPEINIRFQNVPDLMLVVDGEDGVVNEPMQWVVTVYKNGKEIEKKSLVFRDGKEISTDDLNLYYN